MYMGRVEYGVEREILSELNGARVLITGLTASKGVDVARAFADLRARLIVHTTDLSPEVTAIIALLSQTATEIKVYTDPIASNAQAIRFAQLAAEAYGGLDAVINFATIDGSDAATVQSEADVDHLISKTLSPLAHLTRVTANRMRVVFSEGVILNILAMPPTASRREQAVATIARTALATMIDVEARTWADQAVRINGVGPKAFDSITTASTSTGSASIANEPDIAALAVYLASRRGRRVTGYVFDCENESA